MNTLEAIEQRRSVKHYDPDHRFSDEEIETILSHAILSPSSFNIQNWRLVHVTDPELRKNLRAAAWDQAQVTDASMLLVICADVKAWERDPGRYWKNAPDAAQDMIVPMIDSFYRDKEQLQRDEGLRSAGIVAQTMMLTAKSMGYDSCPMIGFDPDSVAKLVQLPEDHIVGLLLAIGKPTKEAQGRGGQVPLSEIVINNQFPA